MEANISLASGRRINIDTSIAATVADARRQIAHDVGVPAHCFRLVTATCAEPNDGDPIGVLCDGPITVVIVRHWVQAHLEGTFARACHYGYRFLWDCRNDTGLDASSNRLSTLPDAVGQLVALQNLNLDNNNFTTLPDAIDGLVALRVLDLRYNRLTTLPDTVGNLAALQRLNLRNNRLTALPDTVGNLAALQRLNLSSNRLTTLPDSVGNLAALQKLSLANNQVTTLPDTVGNLVALQELDIRNNNQLTMTPLSDVVLELFMRIVCHITL